MNVTTRVRSLLALLAAVGLALSATACGRGEDDAATAERQAATQVQEVNRPTTVDGCLRAGEAANTFVLTKSRKATDEETATYELHGVDAENLRPHIGQQVEAYGVLDTQQRVATRSETKEPARTGTTGGTPTVSTSAELDIKRLEVERFTPLNRPCDQ